MVVAPGVAVAPADAEATRQVLAKDGRLRHDLGVIHDGGHVVFPVTRGDHQYEFPARIQRARAYQELLPEEIQAAAPRAFDVIGEIAIVKIPPELPDHAATIGEALREFLDARAVFHDNGVTGEYRVRDLERIAGEGTADTAVAENGLRLHVDVSQAYFSPRLAAERARVAALVRPGERVVDLFGGVGAFAILAQRAGALVTSIDLNPAACRLARQNVSENHARVDVVEGDAAIAGPAAAPADRVIMNLPHGAMDFLPAAAETLGHQEPGSRPKWIHVHSICDDPDGDEARILADLASCGRDARVAKRRHVRNYAKDMDHWAYDVEVRG